MQQRNVKKLYFLKSMVPTDEELAEADRLGIRAMRNGSVAAKSPYCEPAEVVAGFVPVGYLDMKGCKILDQPKPEPSKTGK
jgi:hypothetical protein